MTPVVEGGTVGAVARSTFTRAAGTPLQIGVNSAPFTTVTAPSTSTIDDGTPACPDDVAPDDPDDPGAPPGVEVGVHAEAINPTSRNAASPRRAYRCVRSLPDLIRFPIQRSLVMSL